jgi:hypothetical protein
MNIKMKCMMALLFLSLSLSTVSLTGCAAGGHIGPVGGSAAVG